MTNKDNQDDGLSDFDKHVGDVIDFMNKFCTERKMSYPELYGVLAAVDNHYKSSREQEKIEKRTREFLEGNREFLLNLHEES